MLSEINKFLTGIFLWIIYLVITGAVITNNFLKYYVSWYELILSDCLGYVLASIGVLIYLVAGFKFGSIKKMSGIENQLLLTDGIYRYTRNPQFVGWWMIIGGFFIAHPNTLSLSMLLLGVLVGTIQIRYEEKYLWSQFGENYTQYMTRVKRFF